MPERAHWLLAVAFVEDALARREERDRSPPRSKSKQKQARARREDKSLFFLFFIYTKAPVTAGNNINQVTRRRLNTEKRPQSILYFFFPNQVTAQQIVITNKTLAIHMS